MKQLILCLFFLTSLTGKAQDLQLNDLEYFNDKVSTYWCSAIVSTEVSMMRRTPE